MTTVGRTKDVRPDGTLLIYRKRGDRVPFQVREFGEKFGIKDVKVAKKMATLLRRQGYYVKVNEWGEASK